MNKKENIITTTIIFFILAITAIIIGWNFFYKSNKPNIEQSSKANLTNTQIASTTIEQNQEKINSSTPNNKEVNQIKDNISDWKSYTNTRYKFNIKYPENLFIIGIDTCGGEDPDGPESCSGASLSFREITNLPSTEKVYMNFEILENNSKMEFVSFVDNALSEAKIITKNNLTINNKNAIYVKMSGVIKLGYVSKTIGETMFTFIELSPTEIGYFEYYDKSKNMLEDKIISTFKYLK